MSATISTSSRPARKARLLEWVSSVALAAALIAAAFMVARTWVLNDGLVKSLDATDWVEVRKLIRAGADPRVTGKNGATCLMIAAVGDDVETVASLLERGHEVDARDGEGLTALMHAAANGSTASAIELISRGGSVDAVDSSGSTPLFRAVSSADHSTVDAILRHGADPNVKDTSGWTALMWNSARPRLHFPRPPATRDIASIERWMSSFKAETARVASGGRSPQKLRIARVLLQYGADPRVSGAKGRTALSLAVEASEDGLADLLRRHTARIQDREKSSKRWSD